MIKGFIYQEDTILNMYSSNYRAKIHMRQKWAELIGKLYQSIIIDRDFIYQNN